jgi:DNA-binding MarR family transcriptional regulator
MSARGLTDKQFFSLAEFRYQLRRFLRFSERECRARGLQPQHYQLLVTLRGLPNHLSPSVGTLAERMQLEHHSMVELLDRASEQGLVARKRDARDRRRVSIHLTARGERLTEELAVRHAAELQRMGRDVVAPLLALLRSNSLAEKLRA